MKDLGNHDAKAAEQPHGAETASSALTGRQLFELDVERRGRVLLGGWDFLSRETQELWNSNADMLEAMKAARDQTLAIQHSQETRLNDIYDILNAAIAATGAA